MKDTRPLLKSLAAGMGCTARQALACVAVGALIYSSTVLADSNAEPLAKGTEAFRAGEYETALVYFRRAADTDPQPTLLYNIAVSYYRLGNLDEAEQRFAELSRLPQWQGLAFYNLGLIAEARKNLAQAAEFFQLCLQYSRHEKLTAAAEKKRQRIAAASRTAEPDESVRPAVVKKTALTGKRWAAMTSLAFGRDSNAANLAEDVVRRQAQGEDDYLQWIAYGQKYYSGRPSEGSKVFALASVRQFDHFSALSSQTAGAGVVWEKPIGSIATAGGGQLLYMAMGGDPITTLAQLHWGVKGHVAAQVVGFTYSPSYFLASDKFAHIEGWRHRLDFDWQHKANDVQFKARYRYELNDRQDRHEGQRFVSYSPTQHGLFGEASWAATADLTLQAKVQHVRARYSGTNNLRDLAGLTKEAKRHYHHWQCELAAKYKVAPKWLLSGDIGYYVRDDNFEIYSYNGNRAKVAVEYRF